MKFEFKSNLLIEFFFDGFGRFTLICHYVAGIEEKLEINWNLQITEIRQSPKRFVFTIKKN